MLAIALFKFIRRCTLDDGTGETINLSSLKSNSIDTNFMTCDDEYYCDTYCTPAYMEYYSCGYYGETYYSFTPCISFQYNELSGLAVS